MSDDNGIVTATFDADSDLDAVYDDNGTAKSSTGAYIGDEMGANVTVDIMNLLGIESDFSVKLTGTYNDRVTDLRAYKTGYGFANLDRIRTAKSDNPLSLDIAYGKLAQLRVA